MALTFFWRFENSTTLDGTHDYSAGDTTATVNSAAAFQTATTVVNGYSGDYPTASDYHSFASASIWSNAAGYINVFASAFYINTWVAGSMLAQFWEAAATNNHVNVSMSGTSGSGNLNLQMRISGGATTNITLTGNNIALSTLYYYIVRLNRSTGVARIELYNSAGSLIDSAETTSIPSADFPSTIDTMLVGESAGGASDFYLDNFFVADTYAEPIEDNLSITSYTQYGGGNSAAILIGGSDSGGF